MEPPNVAIHRRILSIALIVLFTLCAMDGCTKRKAPKSSAKPKITPDGHRITEAMEARLAWNMETLVDAYKANGRTNAAWDYSAVKALTAFAKVRSNIAGKPGVWISDVATNCQSAMDGGCTDPMIQYLQLRFSGAGDVDDAAKVLAAKMVGVAQELSKSSYPAIRKYYAWIRASYSVQSAYGYRRSDAPPDLTSAMGQILGGDLLMETLRDPKIPVEEAYDAAHEALMRWQYDETGYAQWSNQFDGIFPSRWPESHLRWLLKGETMIDMAWHARGGGYADKVTPEGWKLFAERLNLAEQSLEKAWTSDPNDPRTAIFMMKVELGRGKDRSKLDLWFNRAMDCDTNSIDACRQKLVYLLPKWYGSREDMLAFGRECVRSEKWGGEVPLVLAEAHWQFSQMIPNDTQRKAYWKLRDVWPDLRASFEKYFTLHPEDAGKRHNYAWYAYHCEQWDKLNELIPQLGQVNYGYFGGKAEYERMISRAAEHSSAKPASSK